MSTVGCCHTVALSGFTTSMSNDVRRHHVFGGLIHNKWHPVASPTGVIQLDK